MKRLNIFFTVLALTLFSIYAKAQDKVIEFINLPKLAQDFVKTYYSENQVSYVKVDKDFLAKSYEVKLNNGTKLEFNSKGYWTEVDAKKSPVPNKIVDPKIRAYVKKSFPNNEIVQISKEGRYIEIELTNGLDLVFNSKGEFVRIDH